MANAGVLGSITPTRSPASTPACSSSVATRAAAAWNSAKVNCRLSQRSATRLGLRSLDATRLVLRLVTGYLRGVLEVPGLGTLCPVCNRPSGDFTEAMSAGTRTWPLGCDGAQLVAGWSPTGGPLFDWRHRLGQRGRLLLPRCPREHLTIKQPSPGPQILAGDCYPSHQPRFDLVTAYIDRH